MHIAFLHNLQTSPVPEQAEFDTPETVKAITQLLNDDARVVQDELRYIISLKTQPLAREQGGNVDHTRYVWMEVHDIVRDTMRGQGLRVPPLKSLTEFNAHSLCVLQQCNV